MQDFIAIDFETATQLRSSACALGMIYVKDHKAVNGFYTLIQPPFNKYISVNINIHNIYPYMTEKENIFKTHWNEIEKFLSQSINYVAHNAQFDKSVMLTTMEYYGISSDVMHEKIDWICTKKIFKQFLKSASLKNCCEKYNIELKNHHNAFHDAIACAKLFLKSFELN